MSGMRVKAIGPESEDLVRPELWTDDSGEVWAVTRVAGEMEPNWATNALHHTDWQDAGGDVDWDKVQDCLANTSSDTALEMQAWLESQ